VVYERVSGGRVPSEDSHRVNLKKQFHLRLLPGRVEDYAALIRRALVTT